MPNKQPCLSSAVEARCQAESTNCSTFLPCARAAFPCTQDSYFDNSLAPFCAAVNLMPAGSSGRQWAESVSNCLVQEVMRYFSNKILQWRKNAVLPSECRALENHMYNQAHSSCFSAMLYNTTFTANESLAFLRKAFPTQYRDRRLLLDLVSQRNRTSEELLTLKTALEEIGFVGCTIADSKTDIDAIAHRFSARLVDPAEANCSNATSDTVRTYALKLNTTGPDICAKFSGLLNFTSLCPVCGDGSVDWPVESCDDGNTVDNDGCSAACQVENFFDCPVLTTGKSSCYKQVCGDGIRVAGEDCDSGRQPGCHWRLCYVQDGYNCSVEPYRLSICKPVCGDGLIVQGELCDDHNTLDGDGCSSTCNVEIGYSCAQTYSNGTSMCVLKQNYTCANEGCFYCGNAMYEPPEDCDNGVSPDVVVDGCDDICHVVQYFDCDNTIGNRSKCRHFSVDFSRQDDQTIGRTFLFTDPGELVFLANPDTLDATRFGDQVSVDWWYFKVNLPLHAPLTGRTGTTLLSL